MTNVLFDGTLVIEWAQALGHDCKVTISAWDSGLRVVGKNDGSVAWLSLIDIGDWLFQLTDPAVDAWRATFPKELNSAVSKLPSRQASILSWAVISKTVCDLLISNPLLLWLLVEDGLFNGRALNAVEQVLSPKQKVLCGYLGLTGSAQQARIIKRAADAHLSIVSARSLVDVLGNDAACDLLSHRKSISSFILHLLDHYPWIARHPIKKLADELQDTENFNLFRTVRQLLYFDDFDPLLRCTSISSLQRLHDSLQADFNRSPNFTPLLDDYGQVAQLPPPPLPGNDEIKPLTSQEEIIREGEEMNSCVNKYIPRVLRGEYFFYHTKYPERLTIGVIVLANRSSGLRDTCLLREVRAPFNRHPSEESMEFITDWFESAVS